MFLFEDVAVEDGKTMQGYDAIVVEQWTVLKVRVQFFFDFLFFFCKSNRWVEADLYIYLSFSSSMQVTEVLGSALIMSANHTLVWNSALLIFIESLRLEKPSKIT